MVIDQQFCLVGTVNMDMRSLWLNFEVTLAVDDEEFTKQMSWLQDTYIQQSHTVDKEEWEKRSIFSRLGTCFLSI